MAEISYEPNWYVVWYWEDDTHFTNRKFMDYEDAVLFAKDR